MLPFFLLNPLYVRCDAYEAKQMEPAGSYSYIRIYNLNSDGLEVERHHVM